MPSLYPQLNQDPFKTGGVMDRPDLQTRKAALMARLGQALTPMDATRLAQRTGLEEENARGVTADFNNRQPGQAGYGGPTGSVFNAGPTGTGGRPAEWNDLRARQANAPAQAPFKSYAVMGAGPSTLPNGYGVVVGPDGRAFVSSNNDDASQPMGGMKTFASAGEANAFAQDQAPIPARANQNVFASGIPQPSAPIPPPTQPAQPGGVFSAGMPSFGQPSPNSIFDQLAGSRLDPMNGALSQAGAMQNLAQGQQAMSQQRKAFPLQQAQGFQNLQRGAQDIQGQKAQLGLYQTQQKMAQTATDNEAFKKAHAPGTGDAVQAYFDAGGSDKQHIAQLKKDAADAVKLGMQKDAAAVKADATAQKQADAAKVEAEKARQVVETADSVMETIDQITPLLNEKTTGIIGAGLSKVPGSDAFKVAQLKDMVLANVGISQLQAMRSASKNGASGFGQLSEKELDLLQASLGNLKQAQGVDEQKAAYAKVRHHFDAWKSAFTKGQQANELPEGWTLK